ncbi:hypothetical protein TgHK011_001384 [Trichoderma gracile]|nr:hypothetical protein TgHK011_001384 [Trichoderma gracile]
MFLCSCSIFIFRISGKRLGFSKVQPRLLFHLVQKIKILTISAAFGLQHSNIRETRSSNTLSSIAMADSSQAHYVVYRIECMFNKTSRHSALYVAMGPHGAGQLLHVRCAVGRPGMLFEKQYFVSNGPESLSTFVYKYPVGNVKVEDVDKLAEICYTIAPPAMQYIGDVCQCGAWVNEACIEFRVAGVMFG